MSATLQQLTEQLLDMAESAGAESTDAMAVHGTSVSIDVRNGALENAERSEATDLGLRVMIGQKQANISTSDIREETLRTMAERAVAMAKEAPDDPYIGLAEAHQLATDWDVAALEICDPSPEPDPTALQDDAALAEAAALAFGGISQVQSASAGYGRNEVHLAASNGFSGGYSRSDRAISCVAIAGTGAAMERDYDYDSRIFQSDLMPASDIGQSAAQRALERSNPKRTPTGAFPVLFDERISGSLIGHLMAAINGASIARGSSWLLHSLGETVLPEGLSVIEDPHRPRCARSRPFDAEGLVTQKRKVIDQGVLTGWTLDLANARKLGMAPTGNAARGVSSPPSPSSWNLELTQGDQSRADLIRDMGTGLLVTSMIGSTINPNTGDYSRGATGFWIENGEIAYPVNECTIAGNLRDMMKTLVPANDARRHLSQVVPSLLVEGLTLAGN
ncbi:MAG: TldD/PmbA family protein [Cognatishimia sp.]|uniref:TldD/PmbA family protein n=1 Tax=Cognatishimia sp. TaxID=2211648 RepID=UPI004058A1DD